MIGSYSAASGRKRWLGRRGSCCRAISLANTSRGSAVHSLNLFPSSSLVCARAWETFRSNTRFLSRFTIDCAAFWVRFHIFKFGSWVVRHSRSAVDLLTPLSVTGARLPRRTDMKILVDGCSLNSTAWLSLQWNEEGFEIRVGAAAPRTLYHVSQRAKRLSKWRISVLLVIFLTTHGLLCCQRERVDVLVT